MMHPVMYLFINKGLGMSPGKIGAQAGHAAVEAYRTSSLKYPGITSHWLDTGYTKLVLEARDTEHLRNIQTYLQDKGFRACPIIDEGRTEIESHSFTALGVEIVDKDELEAEFAFGGFDLYKAPKWKELAEEIKERQTSRWKRLKAAW